MLFEEIYLYLVFAVLTSVSTMILHFTQMLP